jgi:hypothetical protein
MPGQAATNGGELSDFRRWAAFTSAYTLLQTRVVAGLSYLARAFLQKSERICLQVAPFVMVRKAGRSDLGAR